MGNASIGIGNKADIIMDSPKSKQLEPSKIVGNKQNALLDAFFSLSERQQNLIKVHLSAEKHLPQDIDDDQTKLINNTFKHLGIKPIQGGGNFKKYLK